MPEEDVALEALARAQQDQQAASDEPRTLRCPLCCQQFVVRSEAECTAHIEQCRGFHAEYGAGSRRSGLVSGMEALSASESAHPTAAPLPAAGEAGEEPEAELPPTRQAACDAYVAALLPLIPPARVSNGGSAEEAVQFVARLAVALADASLEQQTDAVEFEVDDLIEVTLVPLLKPFDEVQVGEMRRGVRDALDGLRHVAGGGPSGGNGDLFAAAVHDGLLTGLAGLRHCEACGKSGCRLFACTKCKRVRYCGPGCQRAAWPQHKSHCRPVAAEGPEGHPMNIR